MSQWLQLLEKNRAIAVIRYSKINMARNMAHAAAKGGIKLIEITWNSYCPSDLVTELRHDLPHCKIGAGTILNESQLHNAVSAGAQFAFSPHYEKKLLKIALDNYEIPYIPGTFSPSEMLQAWQLGAKVVKIFPIKSLGGIEYVSCLQGPLSQIPMIPTGGITLENAPLMIKAGAIAVGISSSLFPHQTIIDQDWESITTKTKKLLDELQYL